MTNENDDYFSPYIQYLYDKCTIAKSEYITNLPPTCNMFLVSHYNFSVIINEWPTFLAIMFVKSSSNMHKAIIAKQINDYYCNYGSNNEIIDQNKFTISQFKNYLNLFEKVRMYSADYYEKYSLVEVYENFCADVCESLKTKTIQL